MYVHKQHEALGLVGSQQPRTLLESWEYCIKYDNTNSTVTNDDTTQGQYMTARDKTQLGTDTSQHGTQCHNTQTVRHNMSQHYITITEDTWNSPEQYIHRSVEIVRVRV